VCEGETCLCWRDQLPTQRKSFHTTCLCWRDQLPTQRKPFHAICVQGRNLSVLKRPATNTKKAIPYSLCVWAKPVCAEETSYQHKESHSIRPECNGETRMCWSTRPATNTKKAIPYGLYVWAKPFCAEETSNQQYNTERTSSPTKAARLWRVFCGGGEQKWQEAARRVHLWLVLTFYWALPNVDGILRTHLLRLQRSGGTNKVFPEVPLDAFRSDNSLQD